MMPYSSITSMGKKFKNGLQEGLDEYSDCLDYDLQPEYVGSASIKEVKQADNKLYAHHDVDVITGIVNNLTLSECSKSFKREVDYHFTNLGELLICQVDKPQNLNVHSRSLWKDVYALSSYAIQKFSTNGGYAAAYYDTGYAFAPILDVALRNHNHNNFLPVYLAPMPVNGTLSNIANVIDRIEQDMPDWIFAAFCGKEATLFLDLWVERGLHKKIKLFGLPYLLEKSSTLSWDGLEVYTALEHPHHAQNLSISDSETIYDIFHGMGKTAGKHIATKSLKLKYTESSISTNKLALAAYDERKGNFTLDFLTSYDKISSDNDFLKEIISQPSASWQNPYLAI